MKTTNRNGYETWRGSKYQPEMATTDITAGIRKDIREAQDRGDLPGSLVVSVRKEHGGFTPAIRINVTGGLPCDLYNPELIRTHARRLVLQAKGATEAELRAVRFRGERHSEGWLAIQAKLRAIAAEYDEGESHALSDYDRRHFYCWIGVEPAYHNRLFAAAVETAKAEVAAADPDYRETALRG